MRLLDIDVVIDNIIKDMQEEQEKYNEDCLLIDNCEKEEALHTDLLWYFSKCRRFINELERYWDEQQKEIDRDGKDEPSR